VDPNLLLSRNLLLMENRPIVSVVRILFLTVTLFGTMHTASLAWALGDIGVGPMAWLNIIAILSLSRTALKSLSDCEAQKQGKSTIFYSSRN